MTWRLGCFLLCYLLCWSGTIRESSGQPHREHGHLRLAFAAMRDDIFLGPPFQYGRMGSALVIALEDVASTPQLLPNHTLHYNLTPTDCNAKLALNAIVESRPWVDVVIGPACTREIATAGLLASHWNIPIISYTGVSSAVDDKTMYDTLTRLVPAANRIGVIILKIVQGFGWKKTVLVTTATGGPMRYINDGLLAEVKHMKTGSNNFTLVGPYILASTDTEPVMKRVAKTGRVIILLAYTEEVQAAMIVAYDLGFFNTNEYVFVTIDPSSTEEALNFKWLWTGDPEKDRKLAVAYKSCLHITKIPYFMDTSYQQFIGRVQTRLLDPPFQSSLAGISHVSEAAGYVYDAVMLYALTADSMVRQGLDPTDGRAFTRHAKTIHFNGRTGAVSVNEEGQRNDDYAIYDFDNGIFRQVARFAGFTQQYISQRQVMWGPDDLDQPPPDTPACGFEGEMCVAEEELDLATIIAGSVFGVLALGVLWAGIFFYRKKQFEAQLNASNWKIEYDELTFTKDRAKSAVSMTSLGDDGSQNIHALNVAIYKNDKVYIKRINKTTVDWKKRSILLELKMARDLRHENLNTFIGSCVNPGNILLASRLCQKGGLDDVLQNPDIQLDLSFRISIAMDIINGLKYVSKSELGYHGNLKSSNCLVDSRWTIKLSGLGLREFKRPDKSSDPHLQSHKGLLWTAPEHLRDGSEGSVRGDVYSFGIILQEVTLRSGPYSEIDYLSPKEILERVKDNTGVPFRPTLPTGSSEPLMEELMKKCWAEDSTDRPDFAAISKDLRILNGGKAINIMDNMVTMLEKYASNLEGIVEERTVELLVEKKKTDMLLNQMLPESVANQLKGGGTVDPEAFDQVTIFFSDIVGFTSLSSESSPIQVVNLLNDLYTLFDGILSEYDVYKVETIGDAYMVVSGLPIRNGSQHAGEISTVSLHLLSSVLSFKIRHRPDKQLKLRVGIHSGSCVAGVVGQKMPRYCLFGDTVNTASRMESNGKAFRVHVSRDTKRWLDGLGGYHTVERGLVEMKGKGVQMTYWLQGKDEFSMPLPDWDQFDD